MRIATVTWYAGNNYGSTLQAYALQHVIKKNGHDCDILLYKPGKLKNWILKIQNGSVKATLDYKLNEFYIKKQYGNVPSNITLFDQFRSKFQTFSKPVSSNSELKEIEKKYDYFVCGSDQIWSPYYFDPTYFLDFTNPSKRISYAPSFGVNEIPHKKIKQYQKCLKDFNDISVREEQGTKIVKDVLKKEARVVLDPTLLLSAEEWRNIESCNVHEKNYIVCYFLRKNEKYLDFVKKLAIEKNCEIKLIPMVAGDFNKEYATKEPIGPSQWLELIDKAQYVVTDSFHCTVFSIIFKKNFYTFRAFSDNNKRSQNSRIDNLLNFTNLNFRVVNENRVNYEDIDTTVLDRAEILIRNKADEDIEWIMSLLKK